MKERNSVFEILRIFSMYCIVLYHAAFHGPLSTLTGMNVNHVLVQFYLVGGKLGVNLFILLTGYFLINSSVKVNKLKKLWVQVFTYSAGILIIAILVNIKNVHIVPFIRSVFPITFSEYWFITGYFMLYLLAPFLNKFIKNLSISELYKLILILIVFLSIYPSVFRNSIAVSKLGWFILLYVIAATLRLHGIPNVLIGKKRSLCFLTLAVVATYGSVLVFDILGERYSVFAKKALHFAGSYSIFLLALSVAIFIIFIQLTPFVNMHINIFASLVFGVYLIHDNEFVRPLLWHFFLRSDFCHDFIFIHQ